MPYMSGWAIGFIGCLPDAIFKNILLRATFNLKKQLYEMKINGGLKPNRHYGIKNSLFSNFYYCRRIIK